MLVCVRFLNCVTCLCALCVCTWQPVPQFEIDGSGLASWPLYSPVRRGCSTSFACCNGLIRLLLAQVCIGLAGAFPLRIDLVAASFFWVIRGHSCVEFNFVQTSFFSQLICFFNQLGVGAATDGDAVVVGHYSFFF